MSARSVCKWVKGDHSLMIPDLMAYRGGWNASPNKHAFGVYLPCFRKSCGVRNLAHRGQREGGQEKGESAAFERLKIHLRECSPCLRVYIQLELNFVTPFASLALGCCLRRK